jgi:hypothetical protein
MRLRLVLASALLGVAGTAFGQDLNLISAVDVEDAGGTVVLSVRGTKPPNFTTFSMADPPRFVIDLSEARFKGVAEEMAVRGGTIRLVRNLSYGSDAASIARIMIAFEADVEPPEVQTQGATLVVRIAKIGGQLPVARRQDAPPPAPPEAQPAAEAATPAPQTAPVAAAEPAAAVAAAAVAPLAPEAKASDGAPAREEQDDRVAAAKADSERRQQEATALRAEEQRQRDEAAAAARAEAERKAQEEADRRAEGKRQREEAIAAAKTEAERKKLEEADRRAEAERQREEAAAAAKAEGERKKQEEADRRAEAKRQREEAIAAAKAEAEQKKQDESDRRAEAKRQRDEAQAARAAAREAALAVDGPSAQLREVGFRELPGASRVFVRTSAPPRFTIQDVGENVVRIELENTKVLRRNDTRFLDTSFFPSAVAMITPSRRGSSTILDIKLKEKVPYQQRIEGDMLAIDFERPAAAAGAAAVAGAAAADAADKEPASFEGGSVEKEPASVEGGAAAK